MPLSDQDRVRIEEEERYRAEVRWRIRREQQEALRRDRLERMVAGRVRAREEKGRQGRRLLVWVFAAAGAGFLGAALAVASGVFGDRGTAPATTPGSESPRTSPPWDRSSQPADQPADSPASSPRSSSPTVREPALRPAPQARPPAAPPPPGEPPRASGRKLEPPPSLPPRSAAPSGDRVQLMAFRLVESLGPDRAEEAANANAAMYERGNPNFVYWRSVAAAVRSAKARQTSGGS
jgi:hypothetical protein